MIRVPGLLLALPLAAALICHYSHAAVADTGSKDDPRVAYLRLHQTTIRSISPEDRDFSDLEPLRAAIGTRRIVMLGEESHGDGATFLAKIRLIEFLHERMGFNVLAFESGFYDVHYAWQSIAAGGASMPAIRSSIFHLWTNVEQTQALWQYIAAESRTSHPLALAGIDSQFTGTASKQHFMADLEGVLAELPQDAQTQAARARVLGVLRSYFALRGKGIAGLEAFQKVTTLADQARFYIAIDKLCAALKGQEYWVQLLKSVSLQFRHFWHEDFKHFNDNPGPTFDWASFNLRDQAMGENLVWLAQHEYENEKIIVWAATSHEMRHREFLLDEYSGYVPMGDWVDRAMGAEVYTIGFTAFKGRAGIAESRDIGTAAPGSLECLMYETGAGYAFLDFRHLDSDGLWLTDPLSARPLGYQPYVTDWPATMDGMFYITTMTPTTLLPGESL